MKNQNWHFGKIDCNSNEIKYLIAGCLAVWTLSALEQICTLISGRYNTSNYMHTIRSTIQITILLMVTILLALSLRRARRSILRSKLDEKIKLMKEIQLIKMFIVMNIFIWIFFCITVAVFAMYLLNDKINYYLGSIQFLVTIIIPLVNPCLTLYYKDDYSQYFKLNRQCRRNDKGTQIHQ